VKELKNRGAEHLLGSSDFLLGVEPVVHIRAGWSASLDVKIMRPTAYAFFERASFDRGLSSNQHTACTTSILAFGRG
jgi:hypothetical protein